MKAKPAADISLRLLAYHRQLGDVFVPERRTAAEGSEAAVHKQVDVVLNDLWIKASLSEVFLLDLAQHAVLANLLKRRQKLFLTLSTSMSCLNARHAYVSHVLLSWHMTSIASSEESRCD